MPKPLNGSESRKAHLTWLGRGQSKKLVIDTGMSRCHVRGRRRDGRYSYNASMQRLDGFPPSLDSFFLNGAEGFELSKLGADPFRWVLRPEHAPMETTSVSSAKSDLCGKALKRWRRDCLSYDPVDDAPNRCFDPPQARVVTAAVGIG